MNMKATGIVRRIDDLGRVCIPKEIRRTLKVKEGSPMEIFVTNDGVVFKPYVVGIKPDAAKVAQDFLNQYRGSMSRYYPQFSVEGNITKCEVVNRNQRLVGIAKRNPNDKYDANIGMVIAFCRAAGWVLPEGIL